MDAKGRMAIPAKYRETLTAACGGRIVMTAHTQDRCVLVYPETEWQTILPKIEALFHQSGVIRTDTLEELFNVATVLANQPVPPVLSSEAKRKRIEIGMRWVRMWCVTSIGTAMDAFSASTRRAMPHMTRRSQNRRLRTKMGWKLASGKSEAPV